MADRLSEWLSANLALVATIAVQIGLLVWTVAIITQRLGDMERSLESTREYIHQTEQRDNTQEMRITRNEERVQTLIYELDRLRRYVLQQHKPEKPDVAHP